MNKIDIEADSAPSKAGVEPVLSLARKMRTLMEEVSRMEARLEQKKKELHAIEKGELPELMASYSLKTITMSDGVTVEIKDFITANIPSKSAIEKADDEERDGLIDRKQQAFAWLRSHGHDTLIKNEVIVSFGKGEDPKAVALLHELKKKGMNADKEESVHPSTLGAFVKEQLQKGTDIPFATFSIYQGKKASVVMPKAPKKSSKAK